MNRIIFKDHHICRWNPARGFELDGKPVYIAGVNYVARHVCTNFWEDWRPEIITSDLERIAAAGLNAVRIPVHWEYAEPAPGQFRPEMFDHFSTFLDMARERGLFVMPWFLVGVATQDYDVSWRNGESFFSRRITECATRHLRKFMERFKDQPHILCWDICDEPEWYSRHSGADPLPYDTERFHQWMECLYQAIKDADPQRAVTLGFGHIATGNYGMDIRRAAQTLDVMVVTAYAPYGSEDLVNGFRSGYFLGWSVRFNNCANKGVFTCEAPGWSDIEASEENIGAYYRVCLFSNLANGSHGVMPWVWNDFDDAIQHLPPMDKYTTEKRFGIIREDGHLKPAGEELRQFARFIAEFPPSEWPSVLPEAGVLVPVQNPPAAHKEFSLLFHHYIFLRQAGLRVRYVWADDLDDFKGKLLFLPDSSGVPLLTGAWLKLKAWVEQGGTLVSTSRHTSSIFNALFGVTVEGRFRAVDDVVMRDCQDKFSACEGLVLPGGGSYLLVSPARIAIRRGEIAGEPAGAQVLIRDQDSRPLAARYALGKGQALFIAYAPEAALAGIQPEELGRHGIHAFFRGVAQSAGLTSPVTCPDPRIELDVRRHAEPTSSRGASRSGLRRPGGRLIVILINHSRFPVQTVLSNNTNNTTEPVTLDGNGVLWRVFDTETL